MEGFWSFGGGIAMDAGGGYAVLFVIGPYSVEVEEDSGVCFRDG